MDKVQKELEKIRKRHGGLLRPEDVVEFARDETTALHECFQWDDSAAAEQYRLWQARKVISVHVTIIKDDAPPVKTYVSLTTQRGVIGGGYRHIEEVMSNTDMRRQMLTDALAEYQRVSDKYKTLSELAPVFKAVVSVRKRIERERVKAQSVAVVAQV